MFEFAAPLGPFGVLAERSFLTAYKRSFLERRSQELKAAAESDEWRRFVPDAS